MSELRFGVDIGGTGIKGAIVDIGAGLHDRPGAGSRRRSLLHRTLPSSLSSPNSSRRRATPARSDALSRRRSRPASLRPQPTSTRRGSDLGRCRGVRTAGSRRGVGDQRCRRGRCCRNEVWRRAGGQRRRGDADRRYRDRLSGVRPRSCSCPTPSSDTSRSAARSAEKRASEAAREEHDLSRKEWAQRFNRYLEVLEALFWPDLVIIGGGISKSPEKFMPLLEASAPIVAATLANTAGIVGAALAAS